MLTITKDINVVAVGQRPVINLSQYDSDFTLVFNLYASMGAFTMPSGTTAQIQGTKTDGNGYSAAASVSGNTVTVAGHVQMTAAAGPNVYEIAIFNNDKRLSTINFILMVERAALDSDTVSSESVIKDLSNIPEAVEQAEAAADRAEEAARTLTIDPTLTQSGQAADAKVTGDEINDLKEDLNKFYQNKTVTGDIFRFDETSGVLKATPNATVTVGNQNIMPNIINKTIDNPLISSGLTMYKNSDGSVRVYGTATAQATYWVNLSLKIPKGKYTLSGCPSGGSATTYRLTCNYVEEGITKTWLIDNGNGMTADLTAEIDNIRCSIIIFAGATVDLTFYPQLEYASTKSEYVLCENETVLANNEISIDGIKTIFANTAFNLTDSKYGWTDDILNVQNEVNALSDSIDEAEETVAIIDGLLTANVQHFNIDDYSLVCIHHDNFSRTMTGWEIGMNAGGTDTGNNYEWVTAESYDDGLRVDNGATFEANSSRANNFSLRKIATDHANDFAVELNSPTADYQIAFAFDVQDVRNMRCVFARKLAIGYGITMRSIANGTFGTVDFSVEISNVLSKTLTFCFVKNWIYVLADEQIVFSKYVGSVGNSLYLLSYKGYTIHYDFINIFNVQNHVTWNPNHILDTGVFNVPLITTSANDGGYTLQTNNARWSDYADKFVLNSTDPLVHNGRRSERSVANLSEYTGNLRHLRISFDAYFPSTSIDVERTDIMMQMHDRDGTYRGFVPFILTYDNNIIKITLASINMPKGGVDDVVKWVQGAEIALIETDKWHRFDLEIKERYDEDQNPFVKIFIDSKLVFESRKPNCFNDLLGSSPQYGIYKNLWGEGVATFERYFDNFKVTY